LFLTGLILICLGLLSAFGVMAWFGIKRAFGMQPEGLFMEGPYRTTRNPQILGAYLLVFGTALQRPSLYALGWIVMYGLMTHWMVISEEEHLLRVFGEEYEGYCQDVPRYLQIGRKRDPITT
jgi:protein-S-isoprenylcysteine O-methyltransferase Ste14